MNRLQTQKGFDWAQYEVFFLLKTHILLLHVSHRSFPQKLLVNLSLRTARRWLVFYTQTHTGEMPSENSISLPCPKFMVHNLREEAPTALTPDHIFPITLLRCETPHTGYRVYRIGIKAISNQHVCSAVIVIAT